MSDNRTEINPNPTPAGQLAKWTKMQRAGLPADPTRYKRLTYLTKAYVYYGGDMEALKADLEPEKLAELIKGDPWFGATFDKPAELIIEEALLLNLLELSLSKTAQTIPTAKVVLPALNKRRYNQQVQKQETANEGMSELMKLMTEKPPTPAETRAFLIQHDPQLIEMKPEDLRILTLEEAAKEASDSGPVIVDATIEEDEDLR